MIHISKNKITKLLETQLDSNQMTRFVHYPIVRYTEFNNMDDIDKAFKGYDCIIVFFEIENVNSGHWTCLIRGKNSYEFFDSYGLQPDAEFNYITKSKRTELNEQFNSLSRLLNAKRQQGYKIIHNPYPIQKFTLQYDGKVFHPETCGRHVVNRLRNKEKSLNQFILDTYTKNHQLGPDDVIVCYLVSF